MKSVIFSVLAMLLYAVANVLIEQKLSKLNNLTIMICYSTIILAFAVSARQITKTDTDPSFNFPTGSLFYIMLIVGIVYTMADYFYIGAYTNGGNVLMVSSIIALFPAISSLIKFFFTKEMPNAWQVSGYVLAFVAILLIAKGNVK